MADIANIIEAVGATLGAGALVAKPSLSWLNRRNKERVIDDLFLHGSKAIPGVRGALMPAGERLSGVETGLVLANSKLDVHGEQLKRLIATSLSVSRGVQSIVAEVNPDGGSSMRDTVEAISTEQVRLADEKNPHL